MVNNQENTSKKQESMVQELFKKSRDKFVIACIVGIPMLILNQVLDAIADRIMSQPWQVLWMLVPLAVFAYALWQIVKKKGSFQLHKPYLIFFCVYILLFSLASSSQLLDWKRTLIGFEETVPRNWLSLNWMGDWRYHLLQKKAPGTDMMIVTVDPSSDDSRLEQPVRNEDREDNLDSGQPIEADRMQIAKLIKMAADNGARGIAFDFYLPKESPMDAMICFAVAEAKLAKLSVFIGYTFYRHEGDISARSNSKGLNECLPKDKAQGHLVGYYEADNMVRSIPLFFKNQTDRPALSVRIAKSLKEDLETPRLLYFNKPEGDFQTTTYSKLIENEEERERLRDNFILVGERSDRDEFQTPFGKLSGVMIHAYAVHSLRYGQYIKRQPAWMSFLFVFALCFLISVFAGEKMQPGKLIKLTFIASISVIAIAAVSIFLWRVWLAVIYPLVAMWFLLILLLLFNRAFSRR